MNFNEALDRSTAIQSTYVVAFGGHSTNPHRCVGARLLEKSVGAI